MRLIQKQLLEIKKIDYPLSSSVLVIVIGNDLQNALLSLKKQIYTGFRIVCISEERVFSYNTDERKCFHTAERDMCRQLTHTVLKAEEDYVYFLSGEDSLFAHSLLTYIRFLEEQKYDLVYADECRGSMERKAVHYYELKPEYEYIAAFQSLYSGRAVIFKRERLSRIIGQAISTQLDTLLRELFLRCIGDGCEVGKIPLVLLLKEGMSREEEAEKRLLPLIQNNVAKHTGWTGRVSKANSYYSFAFEMIDIEEPCTVEFLIIEEDLGRIRQLLSQIGVSYRDKKVLIAAQKEHIGIISHWCAAMELYHSKIIERERNYTVSLQRLVRESICDVQILLSDQVQWMNRMNIQRLILTFHKPEVKVACPQVATEGKEPRLVYAGGELNTLALESSYFKGREQKAICEYDLAWINHKVVNLTPYCLAVRKEVWERVFPMHASICEAWQFAREFSFLCRRKDMACEYAAQSAVWVNGEVGKWHVEKEGHVVIEPNLHKIRCQGGYWRWLGEYRDMIEEQAEKMRDMQISYLRYLRESFKVYGLENVKETGHKRVLVFSHELSLTGAPLVLVRAVESLKEMNYDVLVVSPVDGPLRDTYLNCNVPVIIEPELFSDFSYIRIVYDFDFVIACTVCLWQVVDVLGQTDIPVLWWIHDSRMGYVNYLRYVLPDKIGDNIYLYCGGDYAQKVISEYRPAYSSKILLYGLEDFSDQIGNTLKREDWDIPKDKIAFANIGQIISRKGQDVLVEAIRRLPDELLQKSVFVFVGSVVDKNIFNKIMGLLKQYPKNICYIRQMSYDHIKEFYREIDCVVCSSTDDPLPAFIAEGLMMSRVCICSDHTAFHGLIEDGKNGFLFESGNAQMLSQKIAQVIRQKEQMKIMKKEARKLYENTFTKSIFEQNFCQVIKEIME